LAGALVLGFVVVSGCQAQPDAALHVTPAMLAALTAFRREPKFQPTGDYTGFQPESDRPQAEAMLNGFVDRLISGLTANPTKAFVVEQIKRLLPPFYDDDTEDREQLCRYLVRIKNIVGIDSFNGLLNRWMYGIDPTFGKGD
jgi:hypothetical protein